jgi:hypothetical protein
MREGVSQRGRGVYQRGRGVSQRGRRGSQRAPKGATAVFAMGTAVAPTGLWGKGSAPDLGLAPQATCLGSFGALSPTLRATSRSSRSRQSSCTEADSAEWLRGDTEP